jgi:hypothetical protein
VRPLDFQVLRLQHVVSCTICAKSGSVAIASRKSMSATVSICISWSFARELPYFTGPFSEKRASEICWIVAVERDQNKEGQTGQAEILHEP